MARWATGLAAAVADAHAAMIPLITSFVVVALAEMGDKRSSSR